MQQQNNTMIIYYESQKSMKAHNFVKISVMPCKCIFCDDFSLINASFHARDKAASLRHCTKCGRTFFREDDLNLFINIVDFDRLFIGNEKITKKPQFYNPTVTVNSYSDLANYDVWVVNEIPETSCDDYGYPRIVSLFVHVKCDDIRINLDYLEKKIYIKTNEYRKNAFNLYKYINDETKDTALEILGEEVCKRRAEIDKKKTRAMNSAIKKRNGEPLGHMPKQRKRSLWS